MEMKKMRESAAHSSCKCKNYPVCKKRNWSSKLKSYNFGWDLAKTLTVPHVIHRDVNGLGLMAQLKSNLFLGTAFVVAEPKPKIQKSFECIAKRKTCVIQQANYRTKQEKDNCPRSTEQCQSCGDSICREHSLRLCVKCLE